MSTPEPRMPPSSMDRPRGFLAVFLATTLVGLAGAAAINALVDPFGIYRLWERPGLNAHKAQQVHHDRMVRAHAMRHARPDALVLGTSRAQVGLEPGSPVLARRAQRPLNVALSGGTPYEMLRQLQHATALGTVRFAVVGLDPVSFNAYGLRTNPEHSEERLAVDADGQPQPLSFAADWPATLLSQQSLRASLATLRRQHEPSYFTPSGRRQGATLEERITQEGGMHRTMLWSEGIYLDAYLCFALFRPDGHSQPLEDLRRLLAFARERGVLLHLFFSPEHARSQLALTIAGHWPDALRWKRAVVQAVAEAGDGAELWDFTGADPRFTAEPVPPPGDTSARMQWYWESSHYRHALGDVVLARLFGEGRPEHEAFGVRLTPVNVEQELRRISRELDTYAAAHPDEVQELEALAAQRRAAWTGCGGEEPPLRRPSQPRFAQD
jgi:hypothetical protein